MEQHKIVSPEEWLAARQALLAKEKEHTRARDALARQRREMPWVRVEKPYVFEGPNGKESLADLFGGRSQLLVQHFMLGPGWKEGCVGCSFGADHVDGARQHFEHNDLSFAAVSRAPIGEIEAFRKRMGWRFHWVSAFGSDFNYDYHVSFTPEQIATGRSYYNYREDENTMDELPGVSVFAKAGSGEIFHTYSAYGRGSEFLAGAYGFLDLTPNGRNETRGMRDWVRHHDRYDHGGSVTPTGRYVAADDACCASGAKQA